MPQVLLAGGPTLVRDAYAHVIAASPAFSLQAHTATIAEALTILSTTACDIVLIEARELAGATPTATWTSLNQAHTSTGSCTKSGCPAERTSWPSPTKAD